MRFRRLVQTAFFLFFLLLLFLAAFPLPGWVDVSLFLKLDPLIALGSMVTARTFIPALTWGLAVVALTLVLGRVFCGYICPMGTTVDLADRVGRGPGSGKGGGIGSGSLRNWKYMILFGVAGGAILGLGFHFLFSPLSIITRFYGLVVFPILSLIGSAVLGPLRPLFSWVGLEGLSFAEVRVPYYSTNLFMAVLVVGILLLGLLQPRFWCRNLCPAGAILGLFSRRPWFRRSVSEECTGCGRCLRSCPTGAVSGDFIETLHSECITCLRCREVCPERAVSFSRRGRAEPSGQQGIGLSRRKFITAAASGAAFSAVSMTSLGHLHGGSDPRPIRASTLIRPPGALPEPQFQDRCVRCGQCVKGCLTNSLQLVWLEAGVSGLWTPKITARQGGCEQHCNVCGHVCPTGAIRPLSMEEKPFAKIGTARIITSRCIAWEQDKRCLICDEICPYNAISSQFAAGRSVTVPVIDENRCNGCGFCENKCPVEGESAVVVEPIGEVRLASGSYKAKAEELGLVFHAKGGVEDQFILDPQGRDGEGAQENPPRGSAGEGASLPPGFIVE